MNSEGAAGGCRKGNCECFGTNGASELLFLCVGEQVLDDPGEPFLQ